MPIRAPRTWMGVTPHLGMPRSAPGRMEPDSPILPAAAGSLPASSPSRKGVERRSEAAEDPLAGRLAVELSGIADQGRDAVVPGAQWPSCQGALDRSNPPSEDGMGLSMSILPDGTPGIERGGLLRSRPQALARHGRARVDVATEGLAATWGIAGVSAEGAFSCPPTSNVGRTLALRPRRQSSGARTPFEATGGEASPSRAFRSRRSCSPSREESNDGTHETKSAWIQRRRMGPEPGEDLSRPKDRQFPDRVARERAQAHPVTLGSTSLGAQSGE